MPASATSLHPDVAARQAAMALCAEATSAELRAALAAVGFTAELQDLRRPETGLVMVRGRIGGDGAPFNLGEATVTRAAVRLPDGAIGFAYHLGRDGAKARLAAALDGLWQGGARGEVEAVLAPVRARLDAERAQQERQTAATRVNFFTLVLGKD